MPVPNIVFQYQLVSADDLDATPVDLTTAYVVSVEGKSVDPNFFHRESELGFTVLETLMDLSMNIAKDKFYELLQSGTEDLSLLVSTMEDAVLLVDEFNKFLPQASEGWGPYGVYNARAHAGTLQPDDSMMGPITWTYIGLLRGSKFNMRHHTVIPDAERFIRRVKAFEQVTKISIGIIKPAPVANPGIKLTVEKHALRVQFRGKNAVQTFFIYGNDLVKIKALLEEEQKSPKGN
jgi:hypothetical protein